MGSLGNKDRGEKVEKEYAENSGAQTRNLGLSQYHVPVNRRLLPTSLCGEIRTACIAQPTVGFPSFWLEACLPVMWAVRAMAFPLSAALAIPHQC